MGQESRLKYGCYLPIFKMDSTLSLLCYYQMKWVCIIFFSFLQFIINQQKKSLSMISTINLVELVFTEKIKNYPLLDLPFHFDQIILAFR